MNPANLLSTCDTALLMVPIFALLALWMFGLDERVAAPRERPARRRFCQPDSLGLALFCDPDGRPVELRRPVTPPPPLLPECK
jgi:hypothetical protein